MKLFGRLVAIFATLFVKREWLELRSQLARVYTSHKSARSGRPCVLAQQLLISGEDHRFFSHGGVDPIAICRAVWRGAICGHREGASTIEMQVVRVIGGRFERTFARKIREMLLATLVTDVIPKNALPETYLRIGYFGWRMNGFRAACLRLNGSPDNLTPIEVARLVARLKYPQACNASAQRWQQIDGRARHLLHLHVRHQKDRTYFGLRKGLPDAALRGFVSTS